MQYFTVLCIFVSNRSVLYNHIFFLASPALINTFKTITVALYISYMKTNKPYKGCGF